MVLDHYRKHQENKQEYARERARAKKGDSNSNLSKYHKETKFGPEFICICCHEGLFENQVLIFSKLREKKLGKKLIESACIIKNGFYDPFKKDRHYICTVLCKMYLTPLVKYYINRVSLSQNYTH